MHLIMTVVLIDCCLHHAAKFGAICVTLLPLLQQTPLMESCLFSIIIEQKAALRYLKLLVA
jgi:hypothetical protein